MPATKEVLIRGTKSEILEYFRNLNIISKNDISSPFMLNCGNRNFYLDDELPIEKQLDNMKYPMGIICYLKESMKDPTIIKLCVEEVYIFVTDFETL